MIQIKINIYILKTCDLYLWNKVGKRKERKKEKTSKQKEEK